MAYAKWHLFRIGLSDARFLVGEGWELAEGESGKAFELINRQGDAKYWLTRKAGEEIQSELNQRLKGKT